MATKMDRIDLITILEGLVSDLLIEYESLDDIVTMADRIRIGEALSQVGQAIRKGATEQALTDYRGVKEPQLEDGIIFRYRQPGQQIRINNAAVKERFPIEENPELYKVSQVKEFVSAEINEVKRPVVVE